MAKPMKDKVSSASSPAKALGRQMIVEAGQDMTADPISVALKRMHDAIVDEPLPEEFLALIEQIDAKIAGRDQTE